MLRKLKENIFPDRGRQVHAIIYHRHLFLPFQGQMAGPIVQFQAGIETASDTEHIRNSRRNAQAALNQKALFQLLDLQIVIQRFVEHESVHPRLSISSSATGNFAFQTDVVLFQMTKINQQA